MWFSFMGEGQSSKIEAKRRRPGKRARSTKVPVRTGFRVAARGRLDGEDAYHERLLRNRDHR